MTIAMRVMSTIGLYDTNTIGYYAPFDCLQGLGVSYGSPHAYSPLSFTSLSGSPVFTTEDSSKTM